MTDQQTTQQMSRPSHLKTNVIFSRKAVITDISALANYGALGTRYPPRTQALMFRMVCVCGNCYVFHFPAPRDWYAVMGLLNAYIAD
jgi:hypothetical protein